MIVSRIKKDDVPALYVVFPVFTRQATLSSLNIANNIVLMKMVWKWLYDPLEPIGFDPQFFVIDHRSGLFFHVLPSLHKDHTAKAPQSLVKYLHFIPQAGSTLFCRE